MKLKWKQPICIINAFHFKNETNKKKISKEVKYPPALFLSIQTIWTKKKVHCMWGA